MNKKLLLISSLFLFMVGMVLWLRPTNDPVIQAELSKPDKKSKKIHSKKDSKGIQKKQIATSSFSNEEANQTASVKGAVDQKFVEPVVEEIADKVFSNPLHEALENGDLEKVDELLKNGDVDLSDPPSGPSTLVLASLAGHQSLTKALLKKGSDPNTKLLAGGFNLLMDAAREGKLEILKLLIESGANVDSQDSFGRTALHFSAEEGHLEIVRALLEKGAKKQKDKEGMSPKDYALRTGMGEVAKILSQ